MTFSKKESLISLNYFRYPNYELETINLLNNIKYKAGGDFVQINNLITICFDLEDIYKIFFYDIIEKKLENIEIKKNKYYKRGEHAYCNKINNKKILVSYLSCGLIINIKEKQLVTKIRQFWDLCGLSKVGNYILACFWNGNISHINLRKGEIYCFYEPKYNEKYFCDYLISIIDIGNKQFYAISNQYDIYLFKYK